MSEPTPVDPDEIPCRRCGVAKGVPCQTPSGAKSSTVHAQRRRDAKAGRIPQPGQPNDKPAPRARKSPATPEGRRKGQATQAQRRRQRASEIAAAEEAERERLQREANEAHAAELAADAVRYERDRRVLRRHTLDAATLSYERLLEGLRGLQRVEVDDDGRPKTTPVERQNRAGDPVVVEVPDVRGAYSAAAVERLSKIAAQSLLSLRLEEDKPTGIFRSEGERGGVSEILGEAGVDELLAWAAENLPNEGKS